VTTSSPVPDDGVVVAQHAESVGRAAAVGVDVVDVRGDPVRAQRVRVVREVGRAGGVGVRRRRAGVVLGGEHERAPARVRHDPVGERRALLAAAGEPDLDAVTRVGAAHLAAHDAVIRRAADAVALAARPLRRRRAAHPAVVDAVAHADAPEAPLREDADLLRVAVGHREPEVEHRQGRLLGIELGLVEVERLGLDAHRGLGLDRLGRRAGEREMEGNRLLELGLDERLVIGEDEAGPRRALAELRRVGDGAGRDVGVVGRLAVGDVELVAGDARIEPRDRGVGVGARQRDVDRVVGVGSADLPALRIEDPLPVGVQV
jgi:hypothetical protein